jgi:quercetin dioxygenase-like cupin family protein
MTTYALTAHETVTIRQATPELLEAEVHWTHGGKLPPAHLHPAQDERFEVLEGTLRVVLDGRERTLSAGEAVEIPRGASHRMTAAGDEGARAIWQTRPALRTIEWWAALDAERSRRGGGDPPLPVMARLVRAHEAELRLQLLPAPLQGPLLRLLAALPVR